MMLDDEKIEISKLFFFSRLMRNVLVAYKEFYLKKRNCQIEKPKIKDMLFVFTFRF